MINRRPWDLYNFRDSPFLNHCDFTRSFSHHSPVILSVTESLVNIQNNLVSPFIFFHFFKLLFVKVVMSTPILLLLYLHFNPKHFILFPQFSVVFIFRQFFYQFYTLDALLFRFLRLVFLGLGLPNLMSFLRWWDIWTEVYF